MGQHAHRWHVQVKTFTHCSRNFPTGLHISKMNEQGPPTPNCTGLQKALEDGMPERRDERQLRDIHHKTDETTTKRKAFAI